MFENHIKNNLIKTEWFQIDNITGHLKTLAKPNIATSGTVDPSETCYTGCPGVFSTPSAELQLAVIVAQPLFTLGLGIFALYLEYIMSLLWGPSVNIDHLFLCQKYYFMGINKS